MNIVELPSSGEYTLEPWERYGAVNNDGTRALRVEVETLGETTHISCVVGYTGVDLAFNGNEVNDCSNYVHPRDRQGRRLSVEVTPPIADAHQRHEAAAAFAEVMFGIESEHPPLEKLAAIAGSVSIILTQR